MRNNRIAVEIKTFKRFSFKSIIKNKENEKIILQCFKRLP